VNKEFCFETITIAYDPADGDYYWGY